jgi:hypothetical protein
MAQGPIATEGQEPGPAVPIGAGTAATGRTRGFESIGRSALAHPVLIIVIALLGLVGGAGTGYEHGVTYTADAKLIVGRTSGLAESQVPGLALAVQGLASDYARLMTTSGVISAVEAELHTSSLPGSLSASPVPESSVIDVQATASTEAGAVSLANAGGQALTAQVIKVTNDTQAQLQPIIANYRKADGAYEAATVQAQTLQTELSGVIAAVGKQAPTPVEQAEEQSLETQIAHAQTEADLARMQADAYLNQYDAALPPLQQQEEMVQQVGTATYTSNNRKSYTEAGGLGGLVGGLIVGLALAALIDTRKGQRRQSAHA